MSRRVRDALGRLIADPPPIADRGVSPAGDGALIRRVRLRLLLWSGGSTLIVLLALGALIYAVVANTLAAAATGQLRERARDVAAGVLVGPGDGPFVNGIGVTTIAAAPGLLVGGSGSGTIAFVRTPEGAVIGADKPVKLLIANQSLAQAAQTGQEVVTEVTVAGVPWRSVSLPVDGPNGTWVIQVVGDRTDEQRTLSVLFWVLVGGGLVALAASVGVGWLYAHRALVPIRDALRRQREFAADASHELRTPLAIIRGSVDHLRRHRDRPVAEVGEALDDLEASTNGLTELVDDLLALARTDSGAIELEVRPTDLGDIAIDAVGGLSNVAEQRHVALHVDAEPVPIRGDPSRLRQLVVLLVDNAIRHSAAAGGRLVSVTVRAAEGRGVVTVDDDGAGIRPADLPRVFDRFWRAPDAPPDGTGLGLAIASWIVDRHDGVISAVNRTSGGARFEVRLPNLLPPGRV